MLCPLPMSSRCPQPLNFPEKLFELSLVLVGAFVFSCIRKHPVPQCCCANLGHGAPEEIFVRPAKKIASFRSESVRSGPEIPASLYEYRYAELFVPIITHLTQHRLCSLERLHHTAVYYRCKLLSRCHLLACIRSLYHRAETADGRRGYALLEICLALRYTQLCLGRHFK